MNNLTQNGLKCYLWGDLLLLQDLRCLHWSPWLKQCLVSNGEINQSSVSEPKCLLCEIRCVVWYRTGFGCADKADSHSYHACHIFKFSFSPFERIFLLKKSKKKKKYNLILPPSCRCVCPVFPHSYFGNALPGFTKYGVNMSLQPLAKFVGRGGGGARETNGPQIFFLPKYSFFFPLLNWRGAKKEVEIFSGLLFWWCKEKKM